MIRGAQYVRMSTERQDYSIANQSAAIESYALLHEIEIVKTYSDPGKSGIDLAHRPGLRNLLRDVANPPTGFEAILVYDVSRWGRFQDIDESAHYEFLCKQAGIHVHYCAEPFAGADSGMMTMLLKAIKRVMAGEYSRELSDKTTAGQFRLARNGFKLGGQAGYGLRRQLIAPDGTPKQILATGERKSLADDRVRYVLGPPEEVAVVKQIFSWYLDEHLSTRAIAEQLNERAIMRESSQRWNRWAVYTILNHPKYMGCVVFNRRTRRLRTRNKPNPKEQWIVSPNSFEAIIPPERFLEVRKQMRKAVHCSDEELLTDLRQVLRKHGQVTARTINATRGVASSSTYRKRFGSLAMAYSAIGYKPQKGYFAAHLTQRRAKLKRELQADFAELFRNAGRKVRSVERGINISGFGSLELQPAECVTLAKGKLVWEVRKGHGTCYGRAIIARVSTDHESILDFMYLEDVPQRISSFRITNKMLCECPRGTAQEVVALITSKSQ